MKIEVSASHIARGERGSVYHNPLSLAIGAAQMCAQDLDRPPVVAVQRGPSMIPLADERAVAKVDCSSFVLVWPEKDREGAIVVRDILLPRKAQIFLRVFDYGDGAGRIRVGEKLYDYGQIVKPFAFELAI